MERIGREEFQAALGNVRAELYQANDELRRSQISREVYLQRIGTLRTAARRFHNEFQQAHRIMYAPTK